MTSLIPLLPNETWVKIVEMALKDAHKKIETLEECFKTHSLHCGSCFGYLELKECNYCKCSICTECDINCNDCDSSVCGTCHNICEGCNTVKCLNCNSYDGKTGDFYCKYCTSAYGLDSDLYI